MTIYRYSGAGNSFVVMDGRNIDTSRFRRASMVRSLCALHGTDGMIILDNAPHVDFAMSYFNQDGSTGMMCGNGGRCAVAFADLLNIRPASGEYVFEAPDGQHRASILSRLGEMKTIRLSMSDVDTLREYPEGLFLNTGTRHLVVFVPDADAVDVGAEGRRLRHLSVFSPEGTNVNFVSVLKDGSLRVRTYEKGVEAETEACGTGVTAAAIASFSRWGAPSGCSGATRSYVVRTNGDILSVEFSTDGGRYTNIFLTGPTLCEGDLFG